MRAQPIGRSQSGLTGPAIGPFDHQPAPRQPGESGRARSLVASNVMRDLATLHSERVRTISALRWPLSDRLKLVG